MGFRRVRELGVGENLGFDVRVKGKGRVLKGKGLGIKGIEHVGSTGAWASGSSKICGLFKSQRSLMTPMLLAWVRPWFGVFQWIVLNPCMLNLRMQLGLDQVLKACTDG